jgi:Purine catabolism regulatory protein-like family/PucR C-terminal helix-turn-helix domain/GGDEF-like domain
VQELLDDPRLGLRLLVPGRLDQEIRWVHTTELADPSRYLQGGEVILTTGVVLTAGTSASAFVGTLARAGVAALGYGLPTPEATTPEELVDACRACGLTLFSVPFERPFIAIGEAFVERLASEREAALQATVQRNAALVRTAEHGGGLEGILQVLERHQGRRCFVVGPGRRLLGVAGTPPAPAEAAAVAAETGRLQPEHPVPVGRWLLFPVVAVGRTEAHLVVEAAEPLSLDDRAAVDQALPFLGLELARGRALRETERRFAAELIDLVSAGPAQLPATAARLDAFGIDPAGPLAAIVCEVASLEDGIRAAERALSDRGVSAVVASKGVEIVALAAFPGGSGGLLELAETLSRELGHGSAVGIGGVVDGAAELRTSVAEARHACRFARLRRTGRAFATHDEVGSHTLLLALQDEEVLRSFRRALLAPLEEHDARRKTDLVATLDAFLGSGGRYKPTADALHIHVNTLRHRLLRIEQLTGRTLDSMEDRVDFFIALRAAS